MVFVMIHCTEKITASYLIVMVTFLSGNRIYQPMQHFQDHFWPDLMVP